MDVSRSISWVFLPLVLVASQVALADSYKDQYRAAEALFEDGAYEESLIQIERVLTSRVTPDSFSQKALELRGRIHRKQDDWQSAMADYEELIQKYGPLRLEPGLDVENLQKKLNQSTRPADFILSYYYNLGQVCRDGARESHGEPREKLVQRALLALTLSRHFGYRTNFTNSAIRELEELRGEAKPQIPEPQSVPVPPSAEVPPSAARVHKTARPRLRWFATVGYLTWEERFEYSDGSNEKSGIDFDARTPCIGGGVSAWVGRFDLGMRACLIYGKGSVEPESSSVDYSHDGIRTYGIFIGPVVRWRPLGPNVTVGVHLPVAYRIAQLPVPDESGASIGERNNFAFAFAFELSSRIGPFTVVQSVGMSPSYSAPIWGIALSFDPAGRISESNE